MNNLTRWPSGNGNGFNPITNNKSKSSLNNPELIVIENEKTEAIKIPKHMIENLKNSSVHFNTHIISSNFPNVRDSFDKEGNFIFKKTVLEERFGDYKSLNFYDEKTGKYRKFSTNTVWNGLVDALTTGHIDNAILGKLIADYFMFDVPTFHNPKFEEQPHIPRSNRTYTNGRKSKKQRKEDLEKDRIRRGYKYLLAQDIDDIIKEDKKADRRHLGLLMKKERDALKSGPGKKGKGTKGRKAREKGQTHKQGKHYTGNNNNSKKRYLTRKNQRTRKQRIGSHSGSHSGSDNEY
jgi:hypothetical protein